MRAGLARLATAVVCAGLTATGVAAHPAGAASGECAPGSACQRWCPGDPDPAGRPIPWDPNLCHDYYWDYQGVHDTGTGAFYSWASLPFKQPPPPGPVPTQTSYLPLPPLPFCPVPPWCP